MLPQIRATASGTVTITAKTRNLGHNTMPESTVCLHLGEPGSDFLIERRGIPPFTTYKSVVISI